MGIKVRLIKDRVLLKSVPVALNSAYANTELIQIPEDYEKALGYIGEVIAFGPDVDGLAVGDTVIYRPHNEYKFSTGSDMDGEMSIVLERDIICPVDDMPEEAYVHVVPWDVRKYDEV